MNYLSLSFAAFVILQLIVYYAVPVRCKWRYIILLAGSIVFYCSFGFEYLPFLAFTALTTYACAMYLDKAKRKKLLFILCIALNAAVWFAIKVLPWAMKIAGYLLNKVGIAGDFTFSALIVPIGISYFTLQALGYLIAVYKGKEAAEKNFLKYLLFVSYFPAIVQGPISKFGDLMPQLLNDTKLSFDTFRKCMLLILVGLVKKMVIADRLAIFVNACFGDYANMTGIILYVAAVFYSLQLYLDFSGCVDICRGVSGLFNVELINNFERPYLARSIKEFWGKWHISLSTWLKENIYIPLGGNRKGKFRKYLNLFITFIVSGIWHGAGISFLFWGALHAVYQIIGEITGKLRDKIRSVLRIEKDSFCEKLIQILITFNLVTFAWIFFRSQSFLDAVKYVLQMVRTPDPSFLLNGGIFEFGINRELFTVLIINIVVLIVVEIFTKSQSSAIDGVLSQHLFIRWSIYLLLIFDVLLFGVYGSGYDISGFLYGGF